MAQAPPPYTTPRACKICLIAHVLKCTHYHVQYVSFYEARTVSISELENKCDNKNAKKSESWIPFYQWKVFESAALVFCR